MVWRIHFSEADLARVQVSPTLGPLAETVLALALLRCWRKPRTMLSESLAAVEATDPTLRAASLRRTAVAPSSTSLAAYPVQLAPACRHGPPP